MEHKTPISELAETLGIDTGAMNQADRQDVVCKAAQERIQELEGFNVGLATENSAQSERIEELEAHVDRLRECLAIAHAAAGDYIESDEVEKQLQETPAQSLQAVKREAVELCLNHVEDIERGYLLNPESTVEGTRAHGKLVAINTARSGILNILGDQ